MTRLECGRCNSYLDFDIGKPQEFREGTAIYMRYCNFNRHRMYVVLLPSGQTIVFSMPSGIHSNYYFCEIVLGEVTTAK